MLFGKRGGLLIIDAVHREKTGGQFFAHASLLLPQAALFFLFCCEVVAAGKQGLGDL